MSSGWSEVGSVELVERSVIVLRDDKIICESCRSQEAMQLIDTVQTQGDVAFCTKLTEQLHCCFDVSSTTGSLTCAPDQLGVIRTSISLRLASWHELCRHEQSDLVSNIAFLGN